MCGEVGLESSEVCLFETRLAFDCLLRHKVSKLGDSMNNVGACKQHINTMKGNIGSEGPSRKDYGEVIDSHIEELNYMRKSFV